MEFEELKKQVNEVIAVLHEEGIYPATYANYIDVDNGVVGFIAVAQGQEYEDIKGEFPISYLGHPDEVREICRKQKEEKKRKHQEKAKRAKQKELNELERRIEELRKNLND